MYTLTRIELIDGSETITGTYPTKGAAETAMIRAIELLLPKVYASGMVLSSSGNIVPDGHFIIINPITGKWPTVSVKVKYDKNIRAYVDPTKLYVWDVKTHSIFAKIIDGKVYRLTTSDVDPMFGTISYRWPLWLLRPRGARRVLLWQGQRRTWHTKVKGRYLDEVPTREEAYALLSEQRLVHLRSGGEEK